LKKGNKMAKHIKSLSDAARTAKKVLANTTASQRVRKNGKPVEPLKGKPAKVEAIRRKERDVTNILRKCVTLRAAKKLAGPEVTREHKAVYAEYLFAGMTPRQVKHLKKRPTAIEALRKEKAAKLLALQLAAEKLVDEKRDHKARVQAAAKVRALRARDEAGQV
jgi:hypothetical protein